MRGWKEGREAVAAAFDWRTQSRKKTLRAYLEIRCWTIHRPLRTKTQPCTASPGISSQEWVPHWKDLQQYDSAKANRTPNFVLRAARRKRLASSRVITRISLRDAFGSSTPVAGFCSSKAPLRPGSLRLYFGASFLVRWFNLLREELYGFGHHCPTFSTKH